MNEAAVSNDIEQQYTRDLAPFNDSPTAGIEPKIPKHRVVAKHRDIYSNVADYVWSEELW